MQAPLLRVRLASSLNERVLRSHGPLRVANDAHMTRRTFTAGALSASVLTALNLRAAPRETQWDGTWKTTHSGVFFIGAMPWVRLFEGDRETCWASVVQADWSLCGAGRLLILRRDGQRRTIGNNETLHHWLKEWLLQSESETLPVDADRYEPGDVELAIDPGARLRARANNIQIEMSEPLDRRLIHREPYPLGNFRPTASWVRIPCAQARVVIDGHPIPGRPNRSDDSFGMSSTAQINTAEVWTT
jgi:hypothetical protein